MRIVIFALAALVFGVSGMASAVQPLVCDSQGVASAETHQGAGCCGEQHQPCGTQGKSCPGTGNSCAQGCGQVQSIDRAWTPFAAVTPTHLSAIAPVTTLISATGPDGQWRPPRAL